jgi:methylenetetrahydrofolate dehydrogenase (NADP+)/methenyltetrahydrofolate cyclohydrolase
MADSAVLMSGVELAKGIVAGCGERAAEFAARAGRLPCLGAVLVGNDPASVTYVQMKQRRCGAAGIESRFVGMSEQATTADVVAAITGLSKDPGVDGILVQHPVPGQVDERAAFEAIAPAKDVDG